MQNIGYVFISYSQKNKSDAEAIRNIVEKNDVNCWMDQYDIPVGSKYAHVINDAIEECSCFVLLLTEEAQESEFVEKELERAVTYRKPIIPLVLKQELILNSGFKFFLGNTQMRMILQTTEQSIEWDNILKEIQGYTCFDGVCNYKICSKSSMQNALVKKGVCKNDIKWILNDDGHLYIDGSGDLECSTLYGQKYSDAIVDSCFKDIKDTVTRVYLGEGLTSIGDFAFYEFEILEEVYIPFTVKKIGVGAFKNCHKLKKAVFPWQLEEIGLFAFENCHSLENFELPENVTLSSEAFKNCYSLTELIKDNSKRITIFQNVFENCHNLKYVRLRNIDLIGSGSFKGCPIDVVELTFCNSSYKRHSQQLQFGAFASSGIRELRLTVTTLLNIPSLTHSIEDDCFKDCDRLRDIYFTDRLPVITPAAIPNPDKICFHMKKSIVNETMLRTLLGENIHVEYL